jgi:hypothetical protein
MNLSMFQTPLAQRAVGAATAAVFLAGIVSAGLVDSEGGPMGPVLAAPSSAATAKIDRGSVGQVPLPPASAPNRTTRIGTSVGRIAARGGGTTTADGGAGSSTSPPGSPRSSPSAPPGSNPPAPVPSGSHPTPSVGVAVGPISLGASPGGVGGDIGGTPVGDPAAAPDQSGGVTVEVDPGMVPPIVIHLP